MVAPFRVEAEMTAEEYNAMRRQESPLLFSEMVVFLVGFFQEETGLTVDGKLGPNTRAEILNSTAITAVAHVSELELRDFALAEAKKDLGRGETGGNNSGPFVEGLHNKTFDGDDDDDGAWCAAFISTCLERACGTMNAMPSGLPDVEMPFKRSGGARRLFKGACAYGRKIAEEEEPVPGDLICWWRGSRDGWMGHIGIVERFEGGIIHTIEGNVGAFPSKVRRFRHERHEHRLLGIARY